jgi:V8-like Glu-specific endopeptidase
MAETPQNLLDQVERAVAADDLERLNEMAETHFRAAEAGPQPFSAAIQLTPRGRAAMAEANVEALTPIEESALALNAANFVERGRRLIRYRRRIRDEPRTPRIVAEGDSWFQYPFLLADIVDVLMEKYAVNCISAAGDTVENMIRSGEYLQAIADVSPALFVFSGGGNDLVGDGKLRAVLRDFSPDAGPNALIDDAIFNPILDEVIDGFETILRTCSRSFAGLKVLSHGYDHPRNLERGPWIWPYMQERNIPIDMARKIIAVLLDRFNNRLAELARRNPNFVHISVLGSVGDNVSSWYDALHPRDPGYRRAADRFIEVIDRLLAEAPPAHESIASRMRASIGPAVALSATLGEGAMPVCRSIKASYMVPSPFPVWADFGPESTWLAFDDPDVHTQIREVISLLERRGEPETPGIVQNRLKMASSAEALPSDFPEVLDSAGLAEAIIGENDLKPVQTLLQGYSASKATGLISRTLSFGGREPRGTGFLVGPGLLLTNHHVLPGPEYAARCILTMDDERPIIRERSDLQRFRITSDLYFASKALDFAFVSVEARNAEGKSLSEYGALELIAASGKAIKREPVSIIQHANGEPKSIALCNSIVMGRVGDGVYYTTDTLPGSSGSCVVSTDWKVVALHHRTVPHPTIRGEYLANRGVRISSILAFIQEKHTVGDKGAARVRELLAAPIAGAGTAVSRRTEFKPAEATGPTGVAAEIIADGVHAGLSAAEALTAIGRTEEDGVHTPSSPIVEVLPSDRESVERAIGERGVRFIIGHEVSSPQEYRLRYKNPILPGGQSGITIGIGYDLGHHTLAELNQHWGGLLPQETLRRLAPCIGRKRPGAASLLPGVRDIEIPYETALEVFRRASLPKYFKLLDDHIEDEQLRRLPPDCVAALVSLTFNRGASYGASGDRYREMREIKVALNSGQFDRVPGLIRSMKRLWVGLPDVRGLLRRRDEEAQLFENGLAAIREPREALRGVALEAADGAGRPLSETEPVEEGPDLETRLFSTIDGDEDSELDRLQLRRVALLEAAPARRRLTLAEVGWVNTFSNNPDYWHLPAEAEGATFTVTGDVVNRLIAAARYEPHFTSDGDLIVAVRGAAIQSGAEVVIEKSGVGLKEQKPDHRTFRCTILVFNKTRNLLSAFKASTVPNRGAVVSQYNKAAGFGGDNANMLPTGCYELCVGTHVNNVTVPTVLRLGTGPTSDDALRVTTLRTINDGVYGTGDFWDNCIPMDNIHPAFSASSADFSSLGCLTVPGRYSGGRHQGNWAKFRETARFNSDARRGTRYNLVLTTGMELAALAAGSNAAGLARLSHGSRGAEVSALQRVIRATDNGVFDAPTKKALVEFEAARLDGKATGIYSSRSERTLGLGVLRSA